jgi:hypothetical protein
MDRAILFERLAHAERHVALCKDRIAQQRKAILQRSPDGRDMARDMAKAKTSLSALVEMYELHQKNRRKLLNQLGLQPRLS